MLKIISWWVRNSKAANLLMFSIIIIGILNFFRVEKEVFPIITAPVVSIKYGWPGASPKEIEDHWPGHLIMCPKPTQWLFFGGNHL